MQDKLRNMNDRLGNPKKHSIGILRNRSKEKKEISIQINTGITSSGTEDRQSSD